MAKENQRVVLVTGVSTGIGQACATHLAAQGFRVYGTSRRPNAALQGAVTMLAADVTDDRSVEQAVAAILDREHRLDILVNNAGVGVLHKPLIDLPVEEWDLVMHTNLRAPYLMIRALAPLMAAARSGHIINISSLAGKNPLPQGAAYSASKWGLNGLTYSVAEELRQYNVRASVIAPGSVDTHFGAGTSTKDRSKMIQPDDVAQVVAMLVTQASASFVSEVLLRPTMKP